MELHDLVNGSSSYCTCFVPIDPALPPLPRSQQIRLPPIKDLYLPTQTGAGDLRKGDDFADDQFGHQQLRNHPRQDSQYSDQLLMGPMSDSYQCSLSPRASTTPKFSPTHSTQVDVSAIRSLSGLKNNFRNVDRAIWRHRMDFAAEYEHRRLPGPAKEDYELILSFWHQCRNGFRSYNPWPQPEGSRERQADKHSLVIAPAKELLSRSADICSHDGVAYRLAAAFNCGLNEAYPIQAEPSCATRTSSSYQSIRMEAYLGSDVNRHDILLDCWLLGSHEFANYPDERDPWPKISAVSR